MRGNKVVINVGLNKELAAQVRDVLVAMNYSKHDVETCYHSILGYIGAGKPSSYCVCNDHTSGTTPSSVVFAATDWFLEQTASPYADLPILGGVADIRLKLNDEYTALVSKDKQTVTIGDAVIPAARVLEVAKALKG